MKKLPRLREKNTVTAPSRHLSKPTGSPVTQRSPGRASKIDIALDLRAVARS